MWKWIGWAAQLVVAALLVSFLSIWTTGYIVTSYVQSALKEYGVTLDQQPFAMSGIWGKLWGADGAKAAAQEGTSSDGGEEASGGTHAGLTPEPKASPDADGAAGSPGASATPDTTESGEGAAAQSDGGDASGDPSPEPGPEPAGSVSQGEAAASPDASGGDEAVPAWNGGNDASAASSLTDEEKQQIYSVVVSKLSSEQLSELTGLIQNGLTEEELPKVEALLKPILSEEEYATMMEALKVPEAQ